ncbi:hypothetical protein SynA18461_02701 [Synechococcus sp. A18-46.1]|nr:hypothetical protein SynA18461_02701 [Synechococcus sp. A18-46.1]
MSCWRDGANKRTIDRILVAGHLPMQKLSRNLVVAASFTRANKSVVQPI